jgi:glycosyltransferase involved in cell wall biosynthesis
MDQPLAIDYVSPLPPVRSGIADYSADLLPHLAERADVRVLRLPGQPVDEALAERWRPAEAASAGEGGRLPLYQMGNNPYHDAVWDLASARPGVVTLHDLVLHHLLIERTLARGEYERYEDALAADHGWIGRAVARPRRWGGTCDAGLFALPVHRRLLRRQRGVLVHSRWAAEAVAEDDPEIPVRPVPMAVPLPRSADAAAGRAFREARRLPAEAPLLGSFGFQTPIKRTLTAVRALAAPGLDRAHLVIVGEVSPELDFEAEARRLGVADRVTVTGFVPAGEMESAIAACELCLNLRYPTAGETSASLLRVLAAGRPAIVSDFAQFADLPRAVALRVPVGGAAGGDAGDGEPRALAAAVAGLLAAPGRLAAMSEAARAYVAREHDPGRAAAAVVAACAELADLEPGGDAPARVPAPTTLTSGAVVGELRVEGTEPPWPEGERRRLRLILTNRGPARWLGARRGPGGVAVEVRLIGTGGDLRAGRPWLALPRDLAAGQGAELEIAVRRPPGSARLEVEPKVVGGAGFGALGGPVWTADV